MILYVSFLYISAPHSKLDYPIPYVSFVQAKNEKGFLTLKSSGAK